MLVLSARLVHCPVLIPTFNWGVEWPCAVPGLPLAVWNCFWVQQYLKCVISEGSRVSQFTNHFTWGEFLGIFTKGFSAIILASLSHSSGHLSGWDFSLSDFVPIPSLRWLWMPLLTLVLLFFLFSCNLWECVCTWQRLFCEYCYFWSFQDARQLIGPFWKTGLSQASIKLLENVLAELLSSKTIPELLQDRF